MTTLDTVLVWLIVALAVVAIGLTWADAWEGGDDGNSDE